MRGYNPKTPNSIGIIFIAVFLLIILCSCFAAKSSLFYDDAQRVSTETRLVENLQNDAP